MLSKNGMTTETLKCLFALPAMIKVNSKKETFTDCKHKGGKKNLSLDRWIMPMLCKTGAYLFMRRKVQYMGNCRSLQSIRNEAERKEMMLVQHSKEKQQMPQTCILCRLFGDIR